MKKIMMWVVGIVVVFAIIGNIFGDDEQTTKEEPKQKVEEASANKEESEPEKEESKEEPQPKKEDTSNKAIEVNDELTFGEFTLKMNEVSVYEKDGKILADISFDWLNQAGDGEKMFMSVSLLDVMQGENILEETTGAWDVMNKNSSDVYFPNAENGVKTVELTYELANKEDPLTIVFQPLNELVEEDGQEIILDIK